MTKKDLFALADALRIHNQTADGRTEFTPDHLLVLANFSASQVPNFNRKRWIDYITAEGRPGDESMVVETDSTVNPEAIVALTQRAVSVQADDPEPNSLALMEKRLISATLRRTGGNIKGSAAILGIDRSTLYDKIKKYAIPR